MSEIERPIHRFSSPSMTRIRPSLIRRMLLRSADLERAGQEIIHLEIGRPDFDTPEPIKQAAIEALQAGEVHYTPARGLPALREAIAADAAHRLGLQVDPDREIIVTAGSSNAIMTALLTVLRPGDEILAPEPLYLFYADWGEPLGVGTVGVPLDEARGYQLSAADLRAKISPRTRLILINSPHNPTGSGLDDASLAAVAEVAREHDLLVLSDEVYDRIVYPPFAHKSVAALPGMKERTIVINSFSKPFAMDGWRIGYLIAPAGLVDDMENVHHRNAMCVSAFGQYGAVEALRLAPAVYRPMLVEYQARRDLCLNLLARIRSVAVFEPLGAFYLWLKLKQPDLDDLTVAVQVLEQAHVSLTPGSAFGARGKGHLRISYAQPQDRLKRGLERLGEVLDGPSRSWGFQRTTSREAV